MPDFEYWTRNRSDRPTEEWFPSWAVGRQHFSAAVNQEIPATQFARDLDVREAEQLLRRAPRVFVSHKKEDKNLAIAIARVAHQVGFDYWLDVEDPDLTALGRRGASDLERARLTALIIEVALLNCSHVVAVLTEKTATSRWVPYEFGRIKDDVVVSDRAASWTKMSPSKAPEYHALGRFISTESELNSWLRSELGAWQAKFGPRSIQPDRWKLGESVVHALR